MPRVTRQQLAAASQQLSSQPPDGSLPATTTAKVPRAAKAAATKKRSISTSKPTQSDPIDAPDGPQPDDANSQPKKRKTSKGTKATKATADKSASTDANMKEEVECEISTQPLKGAEKMPLAEGGIANSADLVVPIDAAATENARLTSNFTVYIDPSGMIYDASLNQTNAMNNNNKFYLAQVLENKTTGEYFCWTRWGRVGERGQTALLGQGSLLDAEKQFQKKFKDKSGLKWDDRTAPPKPGKYAYVEKSYDPDSDDEDAGDKKVVKKEDGDGNASAETAPPVECTLDKPIRELVELIFNQKFFANTMTSFNYDANKLPLGKLGRSTITRGFQALKDLSTVLNDPLAGPRDYNMSSVAAIPHFSNLYYSVIPHSFGRNRPPIINSPAMLKREVEMLESLSDMKAAADILKSEAGTADMHPLDRQFRGLNLQEMTPLARSSKEFKTLTAYLNKSTGSTHHVKYEVIDVFRIARPFEKERFEASKFSTMKSDRRLLWHGSRCTNFGGILSQGLRIAPPEAPVTGYMFDKGIYLADMSSKSAGYTCSYNSDGNGLLLLCEAELGAPMQELQQARYNASQTAKQGGMISTMGQGRTGPQRWVDASAVHPSLKGIKMPDTKSTPGPTNIQNASLLYNEYICYAVEQVQLRYLFRVKID